jgi:carbamoyltransferase
MIIDNIVEATNILLEQKPLVIFQGKSEYGPRALGNRSILFDPRNKDAKIIVNKFKKREWWRPLAGTILLEHVHDWFDIGTLKESPYMSFAVDAKQQSIDKTPSIVHIDNTCRIQTVTKEQNFHYYSLIFEFYKKTGVPMLLNTSFNLAGSTIVETLKQAINVCEISEFKHLYVPDLPKGLKKT